MVLEELPTKTPVSESLVKMILPVPLGVIERFELDVVPTVAPAPFPRLRVVAEIPRVEAVVIEARLEEVIEVAFGRERILLLMVAVAPLAPKLSVVAAPKALTVVALVLNTLKEESLVRTLVVNVGEVPNTATPVPVSSLRVLRREEEGAVVTTFELASRNNMSTRINQLWVCCWHQLLAIS